jgi:guanine deaminase
MTKLIRGQILSFGKTHRDVTHESKGGVVVGDDGTILWSGPLSLLPRNFQGITTDDFDDCIVMPGFIDAHIHFPQLRMLAAPGKDLLDWLTRFTFPEEARYSDFDYAEANAKTFLQYLFANGTTAAMAFCSVHKACADALFGEALSRKMALVTGKTMMDRNALPEVHDDATTGGTDSENLYQAWHGKGRLRYAISPRFAITSTEAQLKVSGELLKSYPDAMMQTHLSESPGEIAWIKTLFPNDKDYTAVYERFGLVKDHSVFAHGIHLSDSECQRLHEAGATIAHCPTSNNFLGSGLMSMKHLGKKERQVSIALATDVGGGTSYSMLATLGETYKVQMLTGYKPSALELFRLATRGNAERLRLDHEIGALETGKFADIVVLDPKATPILAARQDLSQSLEDMLFALMILGDDRAIRATYVAGEKVHDRLAI